MSKVQASEESAAVGVLRRLIQCIAGALVDSPQEVTVDSYEVGRTIVFHLRAIEKDVGQIIGREGQLVNAIRHVLEAAATKLKKRSVLEVSSR